MRRERKSSLRVSLVLIGVAAVSACGEDDHRRDVYASREDCLADWANRPQDCTPATEPRHASSHYWYGPVYADRSSSAGADWMSNARGARSIASSKAGVARGGFGSSARGASG